MSPLEDLLSRKYSAIAITEPGQLGASGVDSEDTPTSALPAASFIISEPSAASDDGTELLDEPVSGLSYAIVEDEAEAGDPTSIQDEVAVETDDSTATEEPWAEHVAETSDFSTLMPFSAAATVPVNVIEVEIPLKERTGGKPAIADVAKTPVDEPVARLLEVETESESDSSEEHAQELVSQFPVELSVVPTTQPIVMTVEAVAEKLTAKTVEPEVEAETESPEKEVAEECELATELSDDSSPDVSEEPAAEDDTEPTAVEEQVMAPAADPTESAETVELQPDWEVDSFLWPSICATIEGRVGQEIGRLVESLRQECAERGTKVVVVAGEPLRGTTTMALCLAREASRNVQSVAVIDLNHRNPTIADRLGVACEAGLESLPRADVDPNGICIVAVNDGVTLMPLLSQIDLDYCNSKPVRSLIEIAADNHDFVLIDASQEVAEAFKAAGHGFCSITVADVSRSGSGVEFDRETLGMIRNFAA